MDAKILNSWEKPLSSSIADLREHLQPGEKINIFGHSVGGLVAMEWAWLYPQEVDRLVLADPSEPVHVRRRLVPEWLKEGTSVALGELFPLGHKLTQLTSSDLNSKFSELRRHYGGRDNARSFDEFLKAEARQRRLATAFEGKNPAPMAKTTLLVGAGLGLQRGFWESQKKLGEQLRAETVFLRGENHMFPVNNPELIRPYLV
ncbi:Hydrolase/acyltransferase [Corynebacterium pseudotuberculosis]|uniref:alpha/beta fold hydrolase n=1 Tax=Corynebacterium pseudotuberculosis TaxID=1719 RepID=UPI0009476FE9|nr:alpha/beta fold hydrolase [Corynebacterium pseudotuberculosis]APQ55002.1 Hydrolase/acyltransferase [Corynebacterium pseudotuberculosis]